jgi:hypothetical protein
MNEPLENPTRDKTPKLPKRSEQSILEWRDRYVTRLDREMSAAFSQLELLLTEQARKKFRKVVFSKNYSLVDDVVQPELDLWVSRFVTPVLSEAESELSEIPRGPRHRFHDTFVLRAREVALSPALLLSGGVGTMSLGLILGIATSGWWIFKKTEVKWPMLLIFLFVGVVLIAFGAKLIATSKDKISTTFRHSCLPKLRESVLGEGSTDTNGNSVASLRQTLQASVQSVAEEHLKRLKTS